MNEISEVNARVFGENENPLGALLFNLIFFLCENSNGIKIHLARVTEYLNVS